MKKVSPKKRLYDMKQFRYRTRRHKKIRKKLLMRYKKRQKYIKGIPYSNRFSKKDLLEKKKFKCTPPSYFSFIESTDELIEYFYRYEKALSQGKPVKFDLTDIDQLWFDALSLLHGMVKHNDSKRTWCLISWSLPNNEKANSLFKKSGFLENVFSTIKTGHIQWGMIWNYTERQVIPEYARKVVDMLFESKSNIPLLFPRLTECMANTKGHTTCKWWLTYYKDTKSSYVCFFDLWEGILNHFGHTEKKWGIQVKADHVKTIEALLTQDSKYLNGVFSSRRESKRGQWLPFIYQFSFDKKVKKAILISNTVKVDMKETKYKKLKNNFHWTFYFWEIDHAN